MKKLVFTLGLCMVAAVCFGQKKAVTDALKLAKDRRPNFTQARTLINGALQNPETKDDAKTWYTAGLIENLQFDNENNKLILGQKPNEEVMYNALFEIFPYFEKAYELDLLPDAKGKVKPQYAKDMKAITKINLNRYLDGGIFFHEQQNLQRAYEFFDQFVVISDSPLMKEGEPENAQAPADSSYIYAKYYAGLTAYTLDHEIAVKAITRASQQEFMQNEMYKYLAELHKSVDDMANFERTIEEGLALFPTESYFLLSLVNIYIDSEKNDKALESMQMALKLDPSNSLLYDVAGQIYEASFNDLPKAEEYYTKSIELNNENAESQLNLGRLYYNQGVIQLSEASTIVDVKKYNEEKEKAKELFRKALPYLEKSFQLNPDSMDAKIALQVIYYNLEMEDKLNDLEKLMEEN